MSLRFWVDLIMRSRSLNRELLSAGGAFVDAAVDAVLLISESSFVVSPLVVSDSASLFVD